MESWKEWCTNLRESLAFRRQQKEAAWIRWLSTYQFGSPGVGEFGAPKGYYIPITRALLSIILPSLYFKNPYTIVKPQVLDQPEATQAAQAMEAFINYFIQGVLPLKRHARKCIIDTYIYNEAYLEQKWQFKTENMATKGQGDIYYGKSSATDSPTVERVSPWDVCYDPYALDDLFNARWYARRTWVPHDFVRYNESFNKNVRAKFAKPDKTNPERNIITQHIESILSGLTGRRGVSTSEDPLEVHIDGMYQLWTLYDRKYNRVMVFNPTVEGFLVDDDNPYAHLPNFPVTKLSFELDTDGIVKPSLVDLVLPQQLEINHICQRQHDNLRRFARIITVEEDTLVDGKEGLRKLEEAQDGTHLDVRKGMGGGIKEIEWSRATQPEWWALRNGVLRDAEFLLGIPPTQTGVGHDKFKSATETSLIQRAFDIRIDDLREQVADWMEQSMAVLGGNLSSLLDMQKKFNIAGEERTLTKEALGDGDFRYQVLLSEAAPENETKRLQKAETIYQMALVDPLMDRRKAILLKLRALGEYSPEEHLAVTEAVPGNIPPGQQGAAGQGVPSEMTPMEGQPGMTGGIGEILSLLAAQQGGGGE